jgi:hypothetical protein
LLELGIQVFLFVQVQLLALVLETVLDQLLGKVLAQELDWVSESVKVPEKL